MTEAEYKKKYYPQDFILVGTEYLPLPKGGKLSIENKEVASTFTTADGSIRKDTIRKYKSVSLQFETLVESGLQQIKKIINAVENADYETKKIICIKKENMPVEFTGSVLTLFENIKIDIVKPVKIGFTFRKNGMFIYNGVTLKIN